MDTNMSGMLPAALKATARQPYLALMRRRGRLVRPLFLDYAVTWRCNARCVMCDTWKAREINPEGVAGELSLAELAGILERDAEFLGEVQKVGLTGGEPFLRQDLVELVRLLHQRLPRARMSLVSNGLMTERILNTLAEIRRFFPELVFSVSLDGLEGVHDQVRGVPGAFAKAMATLKGARELGFTVTSGLTVGRLNHHQVQPVAELLAGMGVDFSCNLQERGGNFHNSGRADELGPAEKAALRRVLERWPHHYYMDNVRAQLDGARRTLPCYAGFTSYFLTPEGNVTICNLISQPLGNLRQQTFRAIADAAATWELRRELADCTCWSQCEVKNSALSAPWHLLAWLARHPRKVQVLRHYAGKLGGRRG